MILTNYSSGFQLIINTAWNLLNTVIIPSGSFGNESDITFINLLLLGVGGLILVKFVRFCMGGNFNSFHDKYKPNTKVDKYGINDFMHSEYDYNEMERVVLNTTPKR